MTSLQVVVDGDLNAAQTVPVDRDSRWRATVAIDAMIEPGIGHRAVAWDPATGTATAARAFEVAREWTRLVAVDHPVGDDTGPSGRDTYPDDAGWRTPRPGDLLGAEVWRSGGALRLTLKLRTPPVLSPCRNRTPTCRTACACARTAGRTRCSPRETPRQAQTAPSSARRRGSTFTMTPTR